MNFPEKQINTVECTSKQKLTNKHAMNKESMKHLNHLSDANKIIIYDILKCEKPTPELEIVKQEIQKILLQKKKCEQRKWRTENIPANFFSIKQLETLHQQHQNDFLNIPEVFVENSLDDTIDSRSSPDGQNIECPYNYLSKPKNGEILSLEDKISSLKREIFEMDTAKKEFLEKEEWVISRIIIL